MLKNHSIAQLNYWLALWRALGIGTVKFSKLLKLFPNLQELFEAASNSLQEFGLSAETRQYLKKPDWQAVEKDLAWAESETHFIITCQDSAYPYLLKQIPDSPPLLFIQGNPNLLNTPQIAIVGTRNPTVTGTETASQFAYHLVQKGLTITSGLALGIDGASHQGALKAGGHTIAVLGSALDCIYPTRHLALAQQIAQQGALISEFPLGVGARAEHFPRRNRVISGLSLGVLVVEASVQSGSLVTARLAAEQGREIFAIPSSIHNPLAKGCHALIKQGAKLVQTSEDVLEELKPLLMAALAAQPIDRITQPLINLFAAKENASPANIPLATSLTVKLDEISLKLLECIGYELTPIDTIVVRSQLAIEKVSALLLELELFGLIAAVPGGYLRLS